MNLMSVTCLICGADMMLTRVIARAYYKTPENSIRIVDLTEWICHTIDCDNKVIVESD